MLAFLLGCVKQSTLETDVPEGYAVVGVPQGEDKPILIGGPVKATVKCICTEGDGCHPWIRKDDDIIQEGCVILECTQCSKEIIVSFPSGEETTLTKATIINLKRGIKIVKDTNEIPEQPVNPIMLELDTVINSLRQYYSGLSWIPDSIHQNWVESDTLGWTMVVFNIFGKWALISHPLGFIDSPYLAVKMGGGNKCACSCGSPKASGCSECRCTWLPEVGKICWCDASGCPECGLSMKQIEYVDPSEMKTKLDTLKVQRIEDHTYKISLRVTSSVSGSATLAIYDTDLQQSGWKVLYTEQITLEKNKPVTKDIVLTVPKGTSPIIIAVSDGIGKIYDSELIFLRI